MWCTRTIPLHSFSPRPPSLNAMVFQGHPLVTNAVLYCFYVMSRMLNNSFYSYRVPRWCISLIHYLKYPQAFCVFIVLVCYLRSLCASVPLLYKHWSQIIAFYKMLEHYLISCSSMFCFQYLRENLLSEHVFRNLFLR